MSAPVDHEIEKLQGLLRRVQEQLEQLREKVNAQLRKLPMINLPGGLGTNTVIQLWNHMCDAMRKFLDRAWDDLESMGEPWTLRDACDRWLTAVGTPLARQSGLVAAERLDADDKFQGHMVGTYVGRARKHSEALSEFSPQFVLPVRDSLTQTANIINKQRAALSLVTAQLAASVSDATVGVTSWTSVPGALSKAANAANVAQASRKAALVDFLNASHEIKVRLENAKVASRGLEDGDWPVAGNLGPAPPTGPPKPK